MTTIPHHVDARPWWRRGWEFGMAPLVDHYRGLSLTRALAIASFAIVAHVAWVAGTLTWVEFWTMASAIGAAFGKGVWGDKFLSRVSLTGSGAEAQTRSDTHVVVDQTITTRRGDRDFEVSP